MAGLMQTELDGRGLERALPRVGVQEPFSFDNGTCAVMTNTLDRAANVFLPDFDVPQMQPNEQTNARYDVSPAVDSRERPVARVPSPSPARPERHIGAAGVDQQVVWPVATDSRGEIGCFVPAPIGPTAAPAHGPRRLAGERHRPAGRLHPGDGHRQLDRVPRAARRSGRALGRRRRPARDQDLPAI